VARLLDRMDADGIDLDWEYPAVPGYPGHPFRPADRHHFTLLVRELREALGQGREITFAAGGTRQCLVEGFEWDSIMTVVDRVHLMSYDLVHGYSTTTGHHTPLFATADQRLSVQSGVELLDSLGVPPSQVVIGAAFYSRVFAHEPPTDHGLHQPGRFSHGIMHRAMDTTVVAHKGWELFRDEVAKAPYAYHATDSLFVTYDDTLSVAGKARYVREHHLGGIMFWQLLDDKPQGGLLDATYRALRQVE
jgi:chitinase